MCCGCCDLFTGYRPTHTFRSQDALSSPSFEIKQLGAEPRLFRYLSPLTSPQSIICSLLDRVALKFINCEAKDGCSDGHCSRGRKDPVNKPTEWDAFFFFFFFAESQTDIKGGPVKSCIRAHFTFCSLSVTLSVFGCGVRALQGSSRIAEHLWNEAPTAQNMSNYWVFDFF